MLNGTLNANLLILLCYCYLSRHWNRSSFK